MAYPKSQFKHVPFAEAIKVESLDSHTYQVNLSEAYCIGAVPNGGYASSCMLAAAKQHLSSRKQPDILTAHFEFLNRTSAGPALILVDEVKLGAQLSTLHLTLIQGNLLNHPPWFEKSDSRRALLCYSTHTELRAFDGLSLPTGWKTTSAAQLPPAPDFEQLKAKQGDDLWELQQAPKGPATVRSLQNWQFYTPRDNPLYPGVLDMWVRLASGELITQDSLPYVVDSFPFNMYTFLAAPEVRQMLVASTKSSAKDTTNAKENRNEADNTRAGLWLPTVVMNIETKTLLPPEGVEWLIVRVTSKQMDDGRFDLEVMVRDLEGEIIALSNHVALIVNIERNTRNHKPSL